MTVSFDEAVSIVAHQVGAQAKVPGSERIPLEEALGRVLAEPVSADRDYPPVSRSIRDGFAVRSADLPGEFQVIGEVRAGQSFSGNVDPGEAVEIMTGAPLPHGADQVVMVEHTQMDSGRMRTDRRPAPGEFINPAAAEARAGETVLATGQRLDFASIAALATVGCSRPLVYSRPRVAILATGDEVIELDQQPEPTQVRNSNSFAVAALVRKSGGEPHILPVAKDTWESTRNSVEIGLTFDLLLLSGGVSAGKYDLVERVLGEAGARFYFDRVRIQPGQPLVFGQARGTFFFGLPGNPGSTMVTCAAFATTAIRLLGGEAQPVLPITWARLSVPFRHAPGLTRFLPAMLHNGCLDPVHTQGSSDVPALARANAFLIARADRERWEAGDMIEVLPR